MRSSVVVITALFLPSSWGKIRHFPHQDERPADSGHKGDTALGKVSFSIYIMDSTRKPNNYSSPTHLNMTLNSTVFFCDD